MEHNILSVLLLITRMLVLSDYSVECISILRSRVAVGGRLILSHGLY